MLISDICLNICINFINVFIAELYCDINKKNSLI